MEKMITNELAKTLLMLGIGAAGVSAIFFKMIAKVRGSFNPYVKATLVYLLISFILFGVVACLAHWSPSRDQFTFYILFQFCFLLLGIMHLHCMHKFLKWSGNNRSTGLELVFTITTAIAGSTSFIIVYRFFNTNGLQYDMVTGVAFFVIPWLVDQTFKSTIAIPPKIFKQWYYPIGEEIIDPDDGKFKNLLLISFEFQKNFAEQNYTNFRAKAPVDMEIGKLFYYFINDFNDRYSNDKIEFITSSGEAYGWIFYKKPKWYTLITHYIHPDKTVFINGIKENDIIICSRMPD